MVKIGNLFAGMSLDEKVALLSCADSWHFAGNVARGLPPALMAEGTHGLSRRWSPAYRESRDGSSPATCLPSPSALANSWDRELLHKAGRLLSIECRAAGVGLAFVPPATIKRSPLCGHGQECYSEDPWLTGELSAAYIEGLQEGGVGAILKHFACDNQEYRRMGINAIVDERSLREIHLAGYEKAVRQGRPWAVSVAGNRINGWLCTENALLLTEVLREDWEYEGVAISDWGAGGLRVRGLNAGLDICLPKPGERSDFWVRVAVLGKEIPELIFGRIMTRTLDAVAWTVDEKKPAVPFDPEKHHAFARRAARESMVLLRNEGLLPLRKGTKLALVGDLAAKPVYQGWDLARVDPVRLETALSELPSFTGNFTYARGYDASSTEGEAGLIREAVDAAASAEAVIVFAGMPEDGSREGRDLADIRLPPNQVELIEAVCAANPRTVVVLSNAAALEVPWLGKTAAVLDAFLAGEAGAGAALDLIFGLYSPSGKLAESWPLSLSDLPSSASFPGSPEDAEYREGLYVGYRWFDSAARKPLFPFGFGLSYAKFEYSDLVLSSSRLDREEKLGLSLVVRNVGPVVGDEIVQVYLRDLESTAYRPDKELRAAARVHLEPGEARTIKFRLDTRAFAFWDCGLRQWCVEEGEFEILVGASSADIRLSARVEHAANYKDYSLVDARSVLPSYYEPGLEFSEAEFETLFGRSLPRRANSAETAYDLDTPLGLLEDSSLPARLIRRDARRRAIGLGRRRSCPRCSEGKLMHGYVLEDLPLRSIVALGEGKPRGNKLKFLLALINLGRGKKA